MFKLQQLIDSSFASDDDSTLDLIHQSYLEWCFLTGSNDEFQDGGDFQPEFITWFEDKINPTELLSQPGDWFGIPKFLKSLFNN